MTPQRWARITEIFGAAFERSKSELSALLDAECAGDTDLRAEVERLLAESGTGGLRSPVDGMFHGAAELSPGETIAHYRIEGRLGEGGMGVVYKARDTRLGRSVALKFVKEQFSNPGQSEAQAIAALNDPHICQIYDVGPNYLVMEYIEGETLAARIQKGALPLDEALTIAVEVAGALAAAHRKGIVHRDFKPGNVMLAGAGAKLLDFGLAKYQRRLEPDDETVTTDFDGDPHVAGTIPYMSPEQVRGLDTDARTDVWALGCVLYEMVTGHRPFTGDTRADVLASILKTRPLPLTSYCADAPAKLQEFVGRALEQDKEQRYQDVKDFLVDLRRLKKRLEFEAEPGRIATLEETAQPQTGPPNNLHSRRTSMVGRERETLEICRELQRVTTRLLTLTGVGGTGKTTLAQAVARQLLPHFPDGVFFVELAPIKQASLVASTVAQALAVKEAEGKPSLEALKEYLIGRSLLLVLDNYEHLPTAVSLPAELLAAAPRLKILVTSRALLHLSLESEYTVSPLAAPEISTPVSPGELTHYEAVRLFVDRARSVKADFALTDENARSVAEICARVDGLPLAIELAAARVKLLSPQAILSRLDRSLKLLTGGARDLPTRQQTISGAMEWSYQLLAEDEKQLFRRLAVFASGFTFEAAEGVVGAPRNVAAVEESVGTGAAAVSEPVDVLEGIASLVDKSLLVAKSGSRDIRFRMLEVVREYALDRLEENGEAQEMRRRHAAYILAFAEQAEPHLQGTQPAEWLNRLEEEHDNIRAALRWLLANDPGRAVRLGAAIRYFWVFQGHLAEGLTSARELLSLCDRIPTEVRWKLLSTAGNLARFQGDYETARTMYEEGLSGGRSARDLRQVSLFCRGLGGLAYEQGDCPTARRFIEEALAVARQANDQFSIARSLNMLGDLARLLGDDASARPLHEEALALCRQIGNRYATANILTNLAAAEYGEGNHAAAYSHFTEGLTMLRGAGDRIVGDKINISYALDGLAAVALGRGEIELAAKLAGAAAQLRELLNYHVEPAERRFRDAYFRVLRAALSEDDFSRAYEQGRKLKLDESVALALGEAGS